MPRGSPDHTLLIDDSYDRYILRRYSLIPTIVPDIDLIEIVNIDFVGVFGFLLWGVDYKALITKIYVDTVRLYDLTPDYMFTHLGLGDKGNICQMGVTRFDDTNKKYYQWIDHKYTVYAHSNVTITVTNIDVVDHNLLGGYFYYKELE